jgi:hypothetical protein
MPAPPSAGKSSAGPVDASPAPSPSYSKCDPSSHTHSVSPAARPNRRPRIPSSSSTIANAPSAANASPRLRLYPSASRSTPTSERSLSRSRLPCVLCSRARMLMKRLAASSEASRSLRADAASAVSLARATRCASASCRSCAAATKAWWTLNFVNRHRFRWLSSRRQSSTSIGVLLSGFSNCFEPVTHSARQVGSKRCDTVGECGFVRVRSSNGGWSKSARGSSVIGSVKKENTASD